mgnify:CR=1 FL=1
MGFIPMKNEDGALAPYEYLPCSAITPKIGMALTQTNGNLAIASGTTVPTYISMIECGAAVEAGTLIPVIRVDKGTIYETVLSAAGTSLKLGNKVTIAADGLRATATTTDGVAEIVAMDGTATGSKVRVRF